MSQELALRQAHAAVKRDDWTQAWLITNSLLNDDPDRPETLFLLGSTLRQMGNIGLALNCLSKALAKEQKHPNLWMAYAATLHDMNRWDEAIEAFSIVHKMLPQDAMPIANIAAGYVQQGKWREAINQADQALKLDPENYIAHIARTFAALALGRWKDGWENARYLYGRHLVERVYRDKENEEPQWDGTPGQTVVVQCDQGLGDQIMFAQCVSELKRDCKEVILECSERMVSLFRRNFPGVAVYGTLKEFGELDWSGHHAIDAHVHISFLGKWYRTLDSDFPRRPYLVAHPQRKQAWLDWLAQYPKPWTGIAWKGGIQATSKHLRSCELEDFEPVINRNGTTFDLSYHDSKSEISRWNLDNMNQIVVPPVDTADYEDTVALADCLDEVVCVTTTILHVRGALGKSVRVIVPSVPQWREAHKYDNGTSMIWYPQDSVKFYRQKPGEADFEFAIKRLVAQL
jgi:tetratricopeptide (TPR) repeat protein